MFKTIDEGIKVYREQLKKYAEYCKKQEEERKQMTDREKFEAQASLGRIGPLQWQAKIRGMAQALGLTLAEQDDTKAEFGLPPF